MTDPVTRLNTALEGRYAIERELGEGGMATVYLADDLRHERKVALKVLKPELAAVVGAERFLAEIKTTANLTHPHILPLFDSGEADGFLFYVMPHIEGESLRERIDREKQLGVDAALAITQKVANALDYAHGHGVVHRDIKPGNILLSEQGEPLVADFGIALAVAQAGAGRITETGLSLGTPHYMSPEQATGDRDVDPRSDVYALGCVLYEMLSGDPPFSASTAQAVLVQILTADAPSITTARRTVPAHVSAALAQALEKLPADRFTSAAEFAAALGDESFTYRSRSRTADPSRVSAGGRVGDPAARSWLSDARSLAALAVISVLATSLAVVMLTESPQLETLRATIPEFELETTGAFNMFAISKTGSFIAAQTSGSGTELSIRRADELEFSEIPGTEDAVYPTFSPDGTWLAFQQAGEIKRVESSGGPILPVTLGQEPHWGAEEMIVFRRGASLYSVPPAGGEPTLLVDGATLLPRRPFLLPDGEAVVFRAGTQNTSSRLMLVEIGSGSVSDLQVAGNNPRYVPTGHLVFGHADQALMAVPFDLRSHRVTGEPFTVLPDVAVHGSGATHFGVSDAGTALYLLSIASNAARLVEVNLDGVETPMTRGEGAFEHPRYSPNGRYVAYELGDQLWVFDRETGTNDQLTPGGRSYKYPVWSRDGRYVYYASFTSVQGLDGFRRLSDLSGEEEQLYGDERYVYPLSASASGDELLMSEVRDGNSNLLIMTVGQDSVIFSDYLRADWNEARGTISPDGRWVAYTSNESGDYDIYVRSFPQATGEVRVSSGGGIEPVWAPDGMAIYFRDPSGSRVMRALVTPGAELRVATPQMLFEGRWSSRSRSFISSNWDLHPDGDTFVMVTDPRAEVPGSASSGIFLRLVVNWFEELKERVPN